MSIQHEGERLFLSLLPRIETLVRKICARHAMRPEEAEDFRSEVFTHLIEGDYRALRAFRGRSRVETYLTTVIHRLLVDRRYRRDGRWRPSAAARRLGPIAVRLETLTYRDGFSSREAISIALGEHGEETSREEVEEIWQRLPSRPPRRSFGELDPERLPFALAAGPTSGRHERRRLERRLGRCLRRAMADLEPEERLILRLRFRDGIALRRIAALLGREERPLYRLSARILLRLRRELTAAGLAWPEVRDLLEEGEAALDLASGSSRRAG